MTEKDEYQICPYCAEQIKHGALKCKYCHSIIEASASSPIEENAIGDDSRQIVLGENADDNAVHENIVKNTEPGEPLDKLSEQSQDTDDPVTDFNRGSKQLAKSHSITPAAKESLQKILKEEIKAMETYKSIFVWLYTISYLVCAIFIGMGFYKMFAYNNPETVRHSNPPVNAYVGGDAYNYIINANFATAYFALAIFCAVIGMTFVLCFLFYTHEIKNELNL